MKTEENRTPIQIFIDWFNFEQENYGTPTPVNVIRQAKEILKIEEKFIVELFNDGLTHGEQGDGSTGKGYFDRHYKTV